MPCMSEWDWLLKVTCNDISDIYVTAHRCAGGLKKKLDLRSGSQRHIHFEGFFNVPIQAPTWGHPFYGFPRNLPISVAFYDAHGVYGGSILILNPRVLHPWESWLFSNSFSPVCIARGCHVYCWTFQTWPVNEWHTSMNMTRRQIEHNCTWYSFI